MAPISQAMVQVGKPVIDPDRAIGQETTMQRRFD